MPYDNAMPDDVEPGTTTDAGAMDDNDELPAPPTAEDTAALEAAVTAWQRRGYHIRYRDTFLIQLVRRDRPGWSSGPYLALFIATLIAAVAALVVALQRRPWHVVTLVIGPDRRILTHQQRSPHPPEP